MRARAREGFRVTDVRDARDVHEKAIEADTEAGMDASAPFPEVEIPFEAFLVPDLFHFLFENLVAFFSLGTPDDFSFARNEAVTCRYRFPVIVLPHVEGFDFLGVVDEEHRAFNHFFGQIAFVFGLKIHAPLDVRVFEFFAGLHGVLKDFDAIRVLHFGERSAQNAVQLIKKAGRNHAIEERHFIGALVESVLDEEFDGFLHKGHVIIEIRERDFRFDHPELACVAGGIRFFGAEGRTKGVNVSESHGERLDMKLTRNREGSAAAEEIRVAQFALIIRRDDGENLAGPLGIVSRDFRRMDVNEPFPLEEFVDSQGENGTKTVKRGESVRARAEIGFVTKVFKRMAFLLKGVIRGALAEDLDRGDMHFERLFHLGSHDNLAMNPDGRPSQKMGNDIMVLKITVIDELDILEASSIIQGDEADRTGIAIGPNPAGKIDVAKFGEVFFGGEARIQFSNGGEFWLHTNKGYPFALFFQSGKEAYLSGYLVRFWLTSGKINPFLFIK